MSTGILLAAHGSRLLPEAGQLVQRLAAELSARGVAEEVVAGFHQGEPGFIGALHRLNGDRVLVLPLFTSEGYYTEQVLPAALAAYRRRNGGVTIRQARPVGTHPGLPPLIADRIREVTRRRGWSPAEMTVLLIGHGTRRNPRSRAATEQIAEQLRARHSDTKIDVAFLDDAPSVESAIATVTGRAVLAIPFLLGGGTHTTQDLPRRLGLAGTLGLEQPLSGGVSGRSIVVDIPVGGYPGFAALLADIARMELADDSAVPARPVGSVALVGAGPGDPGLITVRGLQLLRDADVVLHDRLVAGELLAEVREDAEVIDVGKMPGGGVGQETINALLVERAGRGQRVVRLKGGDPFVFGRGSEELDACRSADIACTVVPGVTSAIAAPAAAGIPVTARGEARSFTVITAASETGASGVALEELAAHATGDTLVLLMSRAALAGAAEALMAAGRDSETPAACIESGTTSRQRVVAGSLGTIARRADAEGLTAPVVTVIGQVARRAAPVEAPC